MAETAPRSNPRLDNFEANKAANEREKFESELYAEAGTTDFSDEARNRVEEADAYERHMEEMAKRERIPLNDDNSAEAIRARISATYDFDAEHPESRAYDQEWDDAIAENEARDARKVAEDEALVAKFAEKGNGNLRLMDRISKEVHELRNKAVDSKTADEDARRLGELENRLQELLERYSESEGYDPAIADMMMDRDDAAAVRRAAEQALVESEGRAVAEKEKNFIEDSEEARLLAQAEDILNTIKSDPEKAEKENLYDKVRELLAKVDEAIAEAKKTEEEKLKTPKDADDEEEIKTPKDADEAEIKTPKDADEDEEEIKTPKDADDAEIKTPKDADDEEEIKTPKDADALIDDDTPEDDEPRRRPNIFSRAWTRINLAFAESNGNPAGVIARGINRGIDRFRNSEHVGRNTALVIGGVAIAGVLIYGRTQGWFDGGHGGGGGHHPGDTGGADQGADTGNHGDGNGHNGDTGGNHTPDPATPEIPKGDTYAHPWNWMNAAVENGSITPPNGMSTEQALHHYGELAAAAGHKVEWYNLPNGLEAIRVDGSDDTKVVADVLTQFAK